MPKRDPRDVCRKGLSAKTARSVRRLAKNRHFNNYGQTRIMLVDMNPRSPLIFFSICAVVDFVFGYAKWHTVLSGVGAIIGGLPLSVLLFFVLRALWNVGDESGTPRT
jgi:hypothetical protein